MRLKKIETNIRSLREILSNNKKYHTSYQYDILITNSTADWHQKYLIESYLDTYLEGSLPMMEVTKDLFKKMIKKESPVENKSKGQGLVELDLF